MVEIEKLRELAPKNTGKDCRDRLISPEHVEPSQIYEGTGLAHALNSVTSAQNFHERVLDNYFHANSVAFYGSDKEHLSYANYTWTCGDATTVAPAKLGAGEYKESDALTIKVSSMYWLLER